MEEQFQIAKPGHKQKGKCPFCETNMEARIVEVNQFRRDMCVCTNEDCKQPVFVCRVPGCHDYAKGTECYDHEFCPECTDMIATAFKERQERQQKLALALLGPLSKLVK